MTARARQGVEQARKPDRLQQIVDRVHFKSLQRISVESRGEYHRRRLVQRLDVLGNLDAVHFRHTDVEQHRVGIARGQHLERLPAIRGFAGDDERHLERAIGNEVAQAIARGRLVVDDEHAQRLVRRHQALTFRYGITMRTS